MKIDLYTRPFDDAFETPQHMIQNNSFLAVPAGEAIPDQVPGNPAEWRISIVESDLRHYDPIALFGVSSDTLKEEFQHKGYALSALEGQVRTHAVASI